MNFQQVAGLPGITEALFNLRLEALAAEKKRSEPEESLVYKCSLCKKEYRSSKAYEQHLATKAHLQKASGKKVYDITVTRPAPTRSIHGVQPTRKDEIEEEGDSTSDEEWEEVDGDEVLSDSHDDYTTSPSRCFCC